MALPSNILEVFQDVLSKFERAPIPYMVVGSLASIVYGEPRMTNDMDLVVEVQTSDAEKIEKLFPLEGFYCPPIEVLRAEIVSRGQFNLLHHNSGLKIDVMIRKQSPHAVEEFKRRQKLSFSKNFEAFLAAPEDIIIKKLSFYREGGSEKHLTDIRGILANTEVDMPYIQKWVDALSLKQEWDKVS
jgi:hypothetical protein